MVRFPVEAHGRVTKKLRIKYRDARTCVSTGEMKKRK